MRGFFGGIGVPFGRRAPHLRVVAPPQPSERPPLRLVPPRPAEQPATAPELPTQESSLSRAFGLFTHYIAGKIVIPYLVIIFILAVFATYTTMNLIAGSLEEKFSEELTAAGRSANEAMVMLEENQLSVLRQMVFTVGVDDAIATRDVETLQQLLAPIAANKSIPYVDVFGADRAQMFALRAPELGEDAATRLDASARDWAPIKAVLDGASDPLGDKFAGFVSAPWGSLLVSAAPLKREGRLVGVIAISLSSEEVASRLSREAGSKGITLYAVDGAPLSSTVKGDPEALARTLALAPHLAQQLLEGGQIISRRSTITGLPYVEMMGALAIRRQPAMVMGVGNLITIIEDRGAQTRNMMMAIFSGVVVIVLGLGLTLARRITRPVRALVDATQRIHRNELNFELPVQTTDETGVLTVAFNEMTGGLREREKSRVAIEKYMSPKVYRLIQTGELGMGGESREITVFDTDIRSFTSISETMEPTALIEFLNRYFTRMVAAIHKYDGEVDKYVGDAILAKFGATEWYPDHARRAVLAMIEMIESCDELDEELKVEGKWVIRMGIGCNTGPAVVGNLGSPDRMEYTIISDAVNTAARAQELTKEYGWDMLISDTTYEQAKEYIEAGEPWKLELRGQTRDTYLYPVLGRKGDVSPRRREAYEALKAHGRSIYADFYEATGIAAPQMHR